MKFPLKKESRLSEQNQLCYSSSSADRAIWFELEAGTTLKFVLVGTQREIRRGVPSSYQIQYRIWILSRGIRQGLNPVFCQAGSGRRFLSKGVRHRSKMSCGGSEVFYQILLMQYAHALMALRSMRESSMQASTALRWPPRSARPCRQRVCTSQGLRAAWTVLTAPSARRPCQQWVLRVPQTGR